MLTLKTNFVQEVRWNFTLRYWGHRGGGRGVGGAGGGQGATQANPSKSYSNADMGKKETTNLNFCVPSLATPPI